MKYQPGLSKTDGEGIERVWSIMNLMSYITREEQPGARHDDHEDLLNRSSFKKNTNQGGLYHSIVSIFLTYCSRIYSGETFAYCTVGKEGPGGLFRGDFVDADAGASGGMAEPGSSLGGGSHAAEPISSARQGFVDIFDQL